MRFALVAVLNFSSASSFALHNSCRFTSSSVSLRRKCGVLHAQLSRPSRRSVVLRLHRRFYILPGESLQGRHVNFSWYQLVTADEMSLPCAQVGNVLSVARNRNVISERFDFNKRRRGVLSSTVSLVPSTHHHPFESSWKKVP